MKMRRKVTEAILPDDETEERMERDHVLRLEAKFDKREAIKAAIKGLVVKSVADYCQQYGVSGKEKNDFYLEIMATIMKTVVGERTNHQR
jgi:hypothetical protein